MSTAIAQPRMCLRGDTKEMLPYLQVALRDDTTGEVSRGALDRQWQIGMRLRFSVTPNLKDYVMRQVGNRVERQMVGHASGTLLAEGARFNEAVNCLSNISYIPKGVYHFVSHFEANEHDQNCLVRAMVDLALERKHG